MADNKNEKLKELTSHIEQALEKAFKDGNGVEDLLNTMSRFPNYSMNNIMLIQAQKPDATLVQGFNAWKRQGRSVIKGQKAIKILAPTIKKEWKEKIDPETKKVIIDKNNKPIKVPKEKVVGYHPVSVFDVAQTKGKKVELGQSVINGKDMKDIYESFKDHLQGTVNVEEVDLINDNARGMARPDSKDIWINTAGNPSPEMKFRTLVHEYAHVKLHNSASAHANASRDEREAQAESVAFATSKYFGLNTDGYSVPYISHWAKDLDLAKKALKDIQGTLSHTINEVEKAVKPLEIKQQQEQSNQFETIFNQQLEGINGNFNSLKVDENSTFEVFDSKNLEVSIGSFKKDENTQEMSFLTDKGKAVSLDDFNNGNARMINVVEDSNGRINPQYNYFSKQYQLEDTEKPAIVDYHSNEKMVEFEKWNTATSIYDNVSMQQTTDYSEFLKDKKTLNESIENDPDKLEMYRLNEPIIKARLGKNEQMLQDSVIRKIGDITDIPDTKTAAVMAQYIQESPQVTTLEELRETQPPVSNSVNYLKSQLEEAIDKTQEYNERLHEKLPDQETIILTEDKDNTEPIISTFDKLKHTLPEEDKNVFSQDDEKNVHEALKGYESFLNGKVTVNKEVEHVQHKSLAHQKEVEVKNKEGDTFRFAINDATSRFGHLRVGQEINLKNKLMNSSGFAIKNMMPKLKKIEELSSGKDQKLVEKTQDDPNKEPDNKEKETLKKSSLSR